MNDQQNGSAQPFHDFSGWTCEQLLRRIRDDEYFTRQPLTRKAIAIVKDKAARTAYAFSDRHIRLS